VSAAFTRGDELAHAGRAEEWTFSFWTADLSLAGHSGWRVDPRTRTGFYWSAVTRSEQPNLHVSADRVPLRSDPLLVKDEALWAEMTCDSPFEQWTVANETYAVALDDPDDALSLAYGTPTAIAGDLEWHAAGVIADLSDDHVRGYAQLGEVDGTIELLGGALHVTAAKAHRTHRWVRAPGAFLAASTQSRALAHTGARAPVRLPDGTVLDLVLTPEGWRSR
jgi:hypothetical protein